MAVVHYRVNAALFILGAPYPPSAASLLLNLTSDAVAKAKLAL
jgi:hypothetical protein